jgi:hypothetical protein
MICASSIHCHAALLIWQRPKKSANKLHSISFSTLEQSMLQLIAQDREASVM